MTTSIERDLIALFDHDADQSLDGADLLFQVQRLQADFEPRRPHRTAWAAGAALVTASVACLFVLSPWADSGGLKPPSTAATDAQTPRSAATNQGPSGSGLSSCAYEYSLEELINLPLAFDGTVIAIGNDVVRFAVNEAFAGVDTPEIAVQMAPPSGDVRAEPIDEFTPRRYGIGTRFLVSGQLEIKGRGQPFAWGCGFTRYWDEQSADAWRNAFS